MTAESRSEFVARYGGIYEHSSWVAERAAPELAECDDPERIAEVMAGCVDDASDDLKLALIRAHPDLAGRARVAGGLTSDSASEQASAGLDRCSAEQYARFTTLNRAYREKFGFPFVMAVRGSSVEDILAAFETRLTNDADAEFETALAEIHKIARQRLLARDGR
jgi:2-oxo-4-hydroxy-4-carboxy-5-ureidoimidazoline decarboxylase